MGEALTQLGTLQHWLKAIGLSGQPGSAYGGREPSFNSSEAAWSKRSHKDYTTTQRVLGDGVEIQHVRRKKTLTASDEKLMLTNA